MAEERGRGHLTSVAERLRILLLIAEAVSSGCRKVQACEAFGLEIRTVQRWESKPSDERRGPITAPANKLTSAERNLVIRTSIGATFTNLSPRQIVPKLADDGIFIASESIFYRILKAEKLNMHRGHTKPRIVERPKSFEAYRPNQIYSWDIHETQEADLSSILLEDICLSAIQILMGLI